MKILYLLLVFLFFSGFVCAQTLPANPPLLKNNEIKFALNEDGSHYFRMTFLNQVWVRWNQSNPGTTVNGTLRAETFDIGLRRTRIQMMGQLNDRVFLYLQFGQNNFNYLSARKLGAFFHDATVEYAFIKKRLSLGTGLAGWSGLARYASPGVGSILEMDAPLFEQATNDINDQFLRKLSVFAKGKLGKLDYRLAVTNPFIVSDAASANNPLNRPVAPLNINSSFSTRPPALQYQGYFMFQFLDQEANLTPYTTGSYLGKKKVFNIGAGFVQQKNAMWHLENVRDTVFTPMRLLAADVFYDTPLNADRGTALTVYAVYTHSDFGPGYVRNLAVMNPANGIRAGQGSFNGEGNAFPMMGTGDTFYAQAGWLTPKKWMGKNGALQPYASCMYSRFDRLADSMLLWNLGINWLISGHNAKFSLNYQNRPVFNTNAQGALRQTSRRGMVVLQYQILI